MKHTIFYKLLTRYILIIVALTSFIVIFSLNTVKTFHIKATAEFLHNSAAELKGQIAPMLLEKRYAEIQKIIKEVKKDVNSRITIILPGGKVIADTDKTPATMENHAGREEVRTALLGLSGEAQRYSQTLNGDMLYVAVPVIAKGKVRGVIRFSMFLKEVKALIGNLYSQIIGLSVLLALLSIISAWVFARNFSKPLVELSTAAKQLALKNFDTRVSSVEYDGEIKEMADSFNEMTNQIKTLFLELTKKKDELDGIICAMKEGLLVVNSFEEIVMCNESFKTIVGMSNLEKIHSWEAIKSIEFNRFVEKILKEKNQFCEEMEINARTYNCCAAYIPNKDEAVVVFHDITEAKNIEKIKKDFVANVSHELKTPLTAIRGFVETMEEQVEEKNRYYLEVVKKNAERLTNIVNDLLVLSELEEKGGKITLEEADLNVVLADCTKIFQAKAIAKGLDLKTDLAVDLPRIRIDVFKMSQVFINLLDNAVKYTEKGSITAKTSYKEKTIIIEIEDTGLGIQPEHIDRIFERFYVADKSRSRKLGGTGLGLAIVKHIVLLHKGDIKVESIFGSGTKFTITLQI